MQFLLIKRNNISDNLNIPQGLFHKNFVISKDIIILFNGSASLNHIKANNKNYLCFGDIIITGDTNNNSFELKNLLTEFNPSRIKDIDGIFYIIEYTQDGNEINVYNSLFSLLPIFYNVNNSGLIISSNIGLIKRFANISFTVNKSFLWQQLLFNYSLFNSTIYNEIKLLKSNSYLSILNDKIDEIKNFNIMDYYVDKPAPWRKSIDSLSNVFIDKAQKYFPASKFFISYTSGFDGRTLTAIAKGLSKEFRTYSFGSHSSDDIFVPLKDNQKLGLNYTPVYLDNEEYIKNGYFRSGSELIELSSGNSNFLYGHFLYANNQLSEERNVFINGFFGSEILRSLHIAGALTSRRLISVFSCKDDNWIKELVNSPKLEFLNKDLFKNEIDNTIEEIKTFKAGLDNGLTLNQKFYVYIFEEVFRKVFGYIIAAQFHNNNMRSPFLNFNFIKELLKTELAGVNNEFFTHNPLLRYKGQTLYARIIEKTYPALIKQTTGKGYKPIDLLRFYRTPLIFYPYIQKRIKRKLVSEDLDNLSILSGLSNNRESFFTLLKESNYYNNKKIKTMFDFLNELPEDDRDALAQTISASYYLNK